MRTDICGVQIDSLTMNETVEKVKSFIKRKESLHLMGINADKINMALKDSKLLKLINECEIINADGASVVIAGRFLKKPIPERVAGIDLMTRLIEMSSKEGFSIYLLGATQDVVIKTAEVLNISYKNLIISGVQNGYFKDNERKKILLDIQEKKPDIVFVGISSPKKEELIEFFLNNDSKSVFMGVGGSFDVISGTIKRAPIWMQHMSMEWFFRMCQEPRRLIKRYIVGNFVFIYHILHERFGK